MGFCIHGCGPILTVHLWPVSQERAQSQRKKSKKLCWKELNLTLAMSPEVQQVTPEFFSACI